MNLQTLIGTCRAASLRVESMLHLEMMCLDDGWPSAAVEAFQEGDGLDNDVWTALGLPSPDPYDLSCPSDILSENDKRGFLVKFATPIPYDVEPTCYAQSWSSYTTRWIYGDALEDVYAAALTWRNEILANSYEQEAELSHP